MKTNDKNSKTITTSMVASLIPYGGKKAITRAKLCLKLNIDDPTLRKLISKARNEGQFIINLQDGRGYFRTDDLDIIERQYKQEHKRAMAILKSLKAMRAWLKLNGRKV